jgi:SAM-dependent methyltransferase
MNGKADLEQRKREFFDGLARGWEERGFTEDELPKVMKLRDRLGDLRGQIVFEPGCGAGRLTRLLAEWVGPRGRVVAVEVSTEMVTAAARTVSGGREPRDWIISEAGTYVLPPSDAHGQVELILGQAEELPLPPATIDLALLFCVFPHFSDKGKALRRFRWLVKPGGRLVISHLTGSELLNSLHEGAGEPVRCDRIPDQPILVEMLRSADLRLLTLVDCDEEFYLEAVPGTIDGSPD